MRTLRTAENPCPWCGYNLDACTNFKDLASPSKGDLSVCINCAGLLIFGEKLLVQKLEQDALEQIAREDPQAYAALIQNQSAALELQKTRRPKPKGFGGKQ